MAAAKKKAPGKASKANGANGSHTGGGKKAAPKKDKPAGLGHNLTEIKKSLGKYADRHLEYIEEKQSFNGKLMQDIRGNYENASNDLGVPRKIVRMALSALVAEQRRQDVENEMKAEDRESLETLRDVLGELYDLPLGQAVVQTQQRKPASAGAGEGSFEQ